MTTKITEQNISNLANIGVQWQSVFTGDGSTGLTAVAGRGYFIDTTSGTVTVTLPASPSAGDVVVLKDYARTWGTNAVTISSTKMDGGTGSTSFNTTGQTVTLVYMDSTKGWSLINEDTSTDLNPDPTFITATGGTVTTSGDYKIHTFTGDGTFAVTQIGNVPLNPLGGPSKVSYMVVAGGGRGGNAHASGGGAGGFREGKEPSDPYSASPLVAPDGLTVSVTSYPVTVGGGGAGGTASVPACTPGNPGSPSVFSTITSTGGGSIGRYNNPEPIASPTSPGGSGAGAASNPGSLGLGNTPPTTPPQGNNGGLGPGAAPNYFGGGGGGATVAGTTGGPSSGGCGGNGASTSITATPTTYAGGGGGGAYNNPVGAPGGSGGGGDGGGSPGYSAPVMDGTANTGGGGGGGGASSGGTPNQGGGSGGKGIVVIRYKYQ